MQNVEQEFKIKVNFYRILNKKFSRVSFSCRFLYFVEKDGKNTGRVVRIIDTWKQAERRPITQG